MSQIDDSNRLLDDVRANAESLKADAKSGDQNAQHIVAFARRLYHKKASLGTYTLLKDRYDLWIASKS